MIRAASLINATFFSQNVVFGGRSGGLRLARSQTFLATLSGFATGGGDALDLLDIKFTGASEARFSGMRTVAS